MRLLIVAGELSGDLYGATLAKGLLELAPDTVLYGIGGEHLRSIVHTFIYETAYSHDVGIKGNFTGWSRRHFFQALVTFIKNNPIDKVIIIDFSHQNFALAKVFQQYRIPIISWITPHFWIWGDKKKAKKVAAYSEKIIAIFQKEYDFYRQFTDKVYYFGHPMVDIAKPHPSTDPRPLTITLFPGSRKQELPLMLPKMLAIMQILSQQGSYRFYLAVSSERFLKKIQAMIAQSKGPKPEIWTGSKEDLFAQTDFLICASGSATLEAMLYRVPMVILGALPHLTYWIAKLIFRLDKRMPYVALPNIMAGKEVIPEFVQYKIQPRKIAKKIQKLLQPEEKKKLLQNYDQVLSSMAPVGSPIKATAKYVLL